MFPENGVYPHFTDLNNCYFMIAIYIHVCIMKANILSIICLQGIASGASLISCRQVKVH